MKKNIIKERWNIMNIGTQELILVLLIALLIFGPSRLPALGKTMGETVKNFKKGAESDENNER